MKAWPSILFSIALVTIGFSQDIQHQVSTINVEVPVRVFRGDAFIDSLKLEDFQIYDNGQPQKIEAVYLVKHKNVLRKEELREFMPDTSRHYYLLFETSEFIPEITQAVEYFVQNVLLPGDHLTLITAVKTYRMKSATLSKIPKSELIRQLVSVVRKDSVIGGAAYRRAMEDLVQISNSLVNALARGSDEARMLTAPGQLDPIATGPEPTLANYETMLEKIENLRSIDQNKMMALAEYLKTTNGQKNVFLFYQREFIPQIDPNLLQRFRDAHQADFVKYKLASLFDYYHREINFETDRIEQAFSDSSIIVNFMFFSKSPDNIPGVRMVASSDDIFSAFNQMARATGGIAVSSANPTYLFRRAVESAENYYLLYYAPRNYRPDQKFHNIEVRVKKGGFRISHRAGYFAD